MVSHFGHTNCQTVKHSEPKFVQSLLAPDFAQTGVYKVTPSIPDICHERHEYIRVIFFWPV